MDTVSQFWNSWFRAEQAVERLDGDGVVGHDRHERHGKDPRRRPPRAAGRLLVAFVGRGGGWEQAWESQRAVLSALAVPCARWPASTLLTPINIRRRCSTASTSMRSSLRRPRRSPRRRSVARRPVRSEPGRGQRHGRRLAPRVGECALRRLVAPHRRRRRLLALRVHGSACASARPRLSRCRGGRRTTFGARCAAARGARALPLRGGGAVPTRTRVAGGLFSRLCSTEFSANGSKTVPCRVGHFTLDDHLAWVPAHHWRYFCGAEFPCRRPTPASALPRGGARGKADRGGARAGATVEELKMCDVPADSRHGMACEKGQVDFAPDAKASGDGKRYSGPPG